MGKYLTSLLILTASLLLPDEIFADEQVRRVQEELRKRHLFYANPNGEKGPALSVAVRRYQQKKGFPATGVIDSVTLASLGISSAVPTAATTPAVVGKRGQVHGANGESLPSHSPFFWPNERVSKFDPAPGDDDYLELALEDFRPAGSRMRQTSSQRVRQTSVNDASGAGFPIFFDLTSERPAGEVMAQPVWHSLVLLPPADGPGELSVLDNERPRQAALRPNRRSQRRSPSVRPREERNPIVLTYRSVNRAIRSLFGETQPKRKRTTAKRL
jgi:peptidoglycan hydrolase-like protein with peptidoglycan-binding domain